MAQRAWAPSVGCSSLAGMHMMDTLMLLLPTRCISELQLGSIIPSSECRLGAATAAIASACREGAACVDGVAATLQVAVGRPEKGRGTPLEAISLRALQLTRLAEAMAEADEQDLFEVAQNSRAPLG